LALGVVDVEPAHAQGFDAQRDVEVLRRCVEKILGDTLTGGRIEAAAHVGGNRCELILVQAWAAAKHHVLKRVRGAGKPLRYLVRSNKVIDFGGDHRREGVANHHHSQAGAQRGAGDIGGLDCNSAQAPSGADVHDGHR
jgi:hypothetical protein